MIKLRGKLFCMFLFKSPREMELKNADQRAAQPAEACIVCQLGVD